MRAARARAPAGVPTLTAATAAVARQEDLVIFPQPFVLGRQALDRRAAPAPARRSSLLLRVPAPATSAPARQQCVSRKHNPGSENNRSERYELDPPKNSASMIIARTPTAIWAGPRKNNLHEALAPGAASGGWRLKGARCVLFTSRTLAETCAKTRESALWNSGAVALGGRWRCSVVALWRTEALMTRATRAARRRRSRAGREY